MPAPEDNAESEFLNFFTQNQEAEEKLLTYNQLKRTHIGSTLSTIVHQNTLDNISMTQIENAEIRDGDIIKFPRLELKTNSRTSEEEHFIVLTPNSINCAIKQSGEKFIFGTDNEKTKNDYNFADNSIGVKQFEIIFDKGIS
jgi:hypothetical protein